MTIQLPTTTSFLDTETPDPDRARSATIALDLSALGVEVFDFDDAASEDFPVETLNFPRLAGMAKAAAQAGLDAVCLGPTFRTRSDLHVRDGRLDAVTAAERLAASTDGRIIAAVPADAYHVGAALDRFRVSADSLPDAEGRIFGLELWIGPSTDMAPLAEQLRTARRAGVTVTAVMTGATALAIDQVLLAESVDVVRLRETDPHRGREVRYAVRSAARRAGTDVRVLVDLFFVVSGCAQDADTRAELIAEIGADRHAAGAARAQGTVHDVADAIESWVANGAADGFVLIPGSLPTDLSSLVMGVLPLLRARGLAEEGDPAAVTVGMG